MKHNIKIKEIGIFMLISLLVTSCGVGSESNDLKKDGLQYKTVKSPYTGRIWIDRNVGAHRACLSATDEQCYGDYYQYGRNADGHEKKNSQLRFTPIAYLDQSDDRFVVYGFNVWFSGPKYILKNNWAKLDGSSICPKNFRVATSSEFEAELFVDGNSEEISRRSDIVAQSLFNTFLKLPVAGARHWLGSRTYEYVGVHPWYWMLGEDALYIDNGLRFGDEFAAIGTGGQVRCIKATEEELEEEKEIRGK